MLHIGEHYKSKLSGYEYIIISSTKNIRNNKNEYWIHGINPVQNYCFGRTDKLKDARKVAEKYVA